MIFRGKDAKTAKPVEGIVRKMLACGKLCQIIEFRLDKGAKIPGHKHPHEQIGFLEKGRFKIVIGDNEYTLGEGDGYWIEPNVDHSVEVLEDTIAIDVFAPPREDFL
ncbi:MAG: cupin domain-containing protein [Methanomassiliicoccales archaeon]|nr:cupin domain-containing protein [Methanomassiliicoccales archaeon]